MSKAFFDLLPVFVIFVIVMVVYGVLGTTLYGHELQAFSTLSESLTTLFLIVLGNSMYTELFSISSVQTIFYYWSFVALVGFLLLNMVLAVIFKVYEDTYSDISAGIRDDKRD